MLLDDAQTCKLFVFSSDITEKLKKKYKSFHIIASQQPKEWFPLEKNIKNWRFAYSGNSLNHAVI